MDLLDLRMVDSGSISETELVRSCCADSVHFT